MPATVSGSKTVNTAAAPHLTAATLTALLAIAPENLTLAQLDQLHDAVRRTPAGSVPTNTIGACLP